MKIFLYRFSLTESPPNLFNDDSDRPDRHEYLHDIFAKEFRYSPRKGINLRYKPTQVDGDIISGVICRWVSGAIVGDPADPFAITEGGYWAKSAFFFNLGNDEQVFGIEDNNEIGKPSAVLKGLIETVNAISGMTHYKINSYSVNVTKSFDEAVAVYAGPVTTLTFDLVLPNPVNGEGATKEALKRLKEKANADRLKATLASREGIKTTSPMVQDVVSYAEHGGGDVVAKDGMHTIYNSKKTVKTVEIDEEFRPTGEEIAGLSDAVSEKLKR